MLEPGFNMELQEASSSPSQLGPQQDQRHPEQWPLAPFLVSWCQAGLGGRAGQGVWAPPTQADDRTSGAADSKTSKQPAPREQGGHQDRYRALKERESTSAEPLGVP